MARPRTQPCTLYFLPHLSHAIHAHEEEAHWEESILLLHGEEKNRSRLSKVFVVLKERARYW